VTPSFWLEVFIELTKLKVTEYLEAFLDDFEIIKLETRLCVDMKILSIKKQAELSALMDSIGKQVTGWRNAGL